MTGIISGVITALLLALFIGGWLWAWSSRRKSTFEAAARLPLQEDGQDHALRTGPRAIDGEQGRSGT